jgi:hypothetical protein
MGETDTTHPIVMLPQNQATYGLALPRLTAEGSSCATPWRIASPEASSLASKFPRRNELVPGTLLIASRSRISGDFYAIDSRSRTLLRVLLSI